MGGGREGEPPPAAPPQETSARSGSARAETNVNLRIPLSIMSMPQVCGNFDFPQTISTHAFEPGAICSGGSASAAKADKGTQDRQHGGRWFGYRFREGCGHTEIVDWKEIGSANSSKMRNATKSSLEHFDRCFGQGILVLPTSYPLLRALLTTQSDLAVPRLRHP